LRHLNPGIKTLGWMPDLCWAVCEEVLPVIEAAPAGIIEDVLAKVRSLLD
jgi:hypothetical protein